MAKLKLQTATRPLYLLSSRQLRLYKSVRLEISNSLRMSLEQSGRCLTSNSSFNAALALLRQQSQHKSLMRYLSKKSTIKEWKIQQKRRNRAHAKKI